MAEFGLLGPDRHGGNMAVHKATKRLHLFTNPRRPEVFMGMSDATNPEPAALIPTPLADSYWDHPSHADAPTVS
jgi:hypothetical protein